MTACMRIVPEPVPPTPPAALAAMDAEGFAEIVRAHLGNDADPAAWDALTHPSVITRTRKCLGALHTDVQAQLALANAELDDVRSQGFGRGDEGRADYFGARNDQAEWRRRIAGFQRLVQKRIAFVKARTPHGPASQPAAPGFTKNARKHNRAALEVLARAIAEHQRAVTSGEGDEDDDETLWAHLTNVTAISAKGGELPVIEWLEHLDDLREDET